jgi:hypothetical protein
MMIPKRIQRKILCDKQKDKQEYDVTVLGLGTHRTIMRAMMYNPYKGKKEPYYHFLNSPL